MRFKEPSDKSVVEYEHGTVNLEEVCNNVEKFYQQEFSKLQELAMDRGEIVPEELSFLASELLTKMREMTEVNDKLDQYIRNNHNNQYGLPSH